MYIVKEERDLRFSNKNTLNLNHCLMETCNGLQWEGLNGSLQVLFTVYIWYTPGINTFNVMHDVPWAGLVMLIVSDTSAHLSWTTWVALTTSDEEEKTRPTLRVVGENYTKSGAGFLLSLTSGTSVTPTAGYRAGCGRLGLRWKVKMSLSKTLNPKLLSKSRLSPCIVGSATISVWPCVCMGKWKMLWSVWSCSARKALCKCCLFTIYSGADNIVTCHLYGYYR